MDEEQPLFIVHREPLEPDELIEQQIRERFAAAARKKRSVRDQIIDTFRDVWQEFYLWELGSCQLLIRGLARTSRRAVEPVFEDALELCCGPGVDDMALDEALDLSFSVYDLEQGSRSTVISSVTSIRSHVKPHPKYEACTPSARNLKSDHDADDGTQAVPLRYIQYAGEPGFNEVEYAMLFDHFVWQAFWRDNDGEVLLPVMFQSFHADQ
ncbi:hypothetical protein SCP_1502630 [Sparassis crispa]|uniref:Uncharacterized protein n=1 Tax=Sparassis crispa TaxID=139825 RepID=A0A401H488_9APHY|nr:hypothetical protein SCP_1502630 [Sparassis crispa]GBE89255.1 hypothetical protein SCP_1502630 [Sparassis crispa]